MLVGMHARTSSLWTRPHVDLGRLASALCRPAAPLGGAAQRHP
ncbi:putative leader peptide [Actinomadura sp. NAK00032]